MSARPLSIDVYVAPMRPYNCPDQLGEGEVATWAPSCSTLISGPTEGILVDALLTFENADQIAAWAKGFGKKIAGDPPSEASVGRGAQGHRGVDGVVPNGAPDFALSHGIALVTVTEGRYMFEARGAAKPRR